MLRREFTEEDYLIKEKNGEKFLEVKQAGECPTCYNRTNGGVYPDYSDRVLYENDKVVAFLEQYPRNPGHTIILTQEHYEDISEMPVEIGTEIMRVTTALTKVFKEVINARKVYMCTMCDAGRNHLHFQLIPRDDESEIGSKVFVKKRGVLVEDKEIIQKIRNKVKENLHE